MNTLGLRVQPKLIDICVFQKGDMRLFKLNIPQSLDLPQQLKFVRFTMLDILRQYQIEKTVIKKTEGNANINLARAQLEAVVIESIASSQVKKYVLGTLSTISKLTTISYDKIKENIKGKENDLDISEWNNYNENQREAILCAMGAKNA